MNTYKTISELIADGTSGIEERRSTEIIVKSKLRPHWFESVFMEDYRSDEPGTKDEVDPATRATDRPVKANKPKRNLWLPINDIP